MAIEVNATRQLDSKGRVVIPTQVLKNLNWHIGEKIGFIINDDKTLTLFYVEEEN